MAEFERNKPGERLDFGGVDLVHQPDSMPPNKFPFAQNVRRYQKFGIKGRNLLTGALYTLAAAVHSLKRLNDSTPNGPPSGYSIVNGAGSVLSIWNSTLGVETCATGMSGNPLSMVPFRPNASVQPWMYIGDSSQSTLISANVTLIPTPAMSGGTWTTPANATSTVNYAVAFVALIGGSGNLVAAVPPQLIPSNATITGVSASIKAYKTGSTGVTMGLVPSFPGSVLQGQTLVSNSSPGAYIFGGQNNLWGTSISAAQINAGFTFTFAAQASIGGNTLYLNSLVITVYYSVPSTFPATGMLKVRSDGLTYKMGIKEPQLAPVVSTNNTTVSVTSTLLATAIPWSNQTGANTSYNYGESNGYPGTDGTAPFIVNVANASTVTISALTGSATVNGSVHAPTDTSSAWVVSANPGFPGQFIQIAGTGGTPASASVVVGAFTDGAGNVVPIGAAPLFVPSVVDIGGAFSGSTMITVPFGAQQLQIGINSVGNTYNSNSGSYLITVGVTTNALPTVTSILGNLSLGYFPDSPTTGPVSAYIWKNADDPGGSGPVREISGATGTTTGNSFIFDATFGAAAVPPQPAGIPGLPGIGNPSVPMQWTSLNPQSVASGSNAVFQPALKGVDGNTAYQNFNFCLTGSIFFPQPGNYTFVLTSHDDCIWGIGGGVKLVSASAVNQGGSVSTSLSNQGQTITVVSAIPLLPRGNNTGGSGGDYVASTVVVRVANAGVYPIELDYDYWYHSGRILLLEASPIPGGSPTIIPPLPANIRQLVQYRYVYRSSTTGALSNPSPESTAQSIPVLANTVTSLWSNDPQVDVVDYYRIDSVTAAFTYVATGPNDNLGGGGTNTPITDSLLDTELSNQLLDYDNFEPFPSIDLPQKGICSVSGGVITWVSGGAIGGSATGFNPRWLAGTIILIGSPTSLAYTFISRPVSNKVTIPDVPDGSNLAYEIAEPILAAQPLAYIWGPTDNINFAYGVGDSLRPGTLYWCKGSNLDSAPDTNQLDVCSPDEPLINGAISGGLGVLFSIKRAWLISPNFFNALATVTGTEGSTWSLQESSITRGLYIPRCVCVSGGGNIFFRVDDGIHISARGGASQSITDQDLYVLFQHENAAPPVAVTIAGYTIYPPDDTQPQLQKFAVQGAYVYWDYLGIDGAPHTLVFDEAAMGWVYDLYTPPATVHAADEGQSIGETLVGCNDGSIRLLSSAGTEVATAVILTPAADKGDTRASAQWGDLYIETTNP